MSSIFNWFQFFLCPKQDASVWSARPGVVSAESCLSLFHKDTILELSLAQLTPVLHQNLQLSTLFSARASKSRARFSLLRAPLRNWFLLGTPSVSTHPHIWLAGLCSLFLCYIVASCFAYILDVAQRSCITRNIAKGTTDPRVEFISQVPHKF